VEVDIPTIEKTEIDFDKNGKPIIEMFVGPETYEQFRNSPPPTHEEQQAFRELLERKKAEFNARQRRRRLS
jgi:hypothetical protein